MENEIDSEFYLTKEKIKEDHILNLIKDKNPSLRYYNLLNDYDIKQFKYSLTSLETNLINFKFINNKAKLTISKKTEVSKQMLNSLILNEKNYKLSNKYNYFDQNYLILGSNSDKNITSIHPQQNRPQQSVAISQVDLNYQYPINSEIRQNVEENKKEIVVLNSKPGNENNHLHDVKELTKYINKELYYDYLSIFLFFKYSYFSIKNYQNPNKINEISRNSEFEQIRKNMDTKIKQVHYKMNVQSQGEFYNKLTAQINNKGILEDFNEILLLMQSFNSENNYLKNMIHQIALFQFNHEIYFTWKLFIGRLLSHWELNNKAGVYPKFKLKYLIIKSILEKISILKENNKIISSLVPSKESNNDNLSIIKLKLFFSEIVEGNLDIPRLCFKPESSFIIFIYLLVDIQIIYFLITIPINYILNVHNIFSSFSDQINNGIYFIHLCYKFRTLVYDKMNNIKMNLNEILEIILKDPLIYLDIITLIPLEILLEDNGDPVNPLNNYFYFFKFLILFRIFRFGKTIEVLEKTKWAKLFRLVVLLGKFMILIIWIGLFLLFIFSPKSSSVEFSQPDCAVDNLMTTQLSTYCLLVNGLYWGGFTVMGKNLNSIDFTSASDMNLNKYIFIFLSFFLGQIITAYIFSGVSELIQSMNNAENKYSDMLDDVRNLSKSFNFNEEVFSEIKLYYEYIWHKNREKIYDMDMFSNISRELKDKLYRAMIPFYEYILKDFVILNQKDNNFLSIIINNLEKYIALPYDRIYTQGYLIPGIFILYDGELFLDNDYLVEKQFDIEPKLEDSFFVFNVTVKENKNISKRNDLVSHHSLHKYEYDQLIRKYNNIQNIIKNDNRRLLFGVDSTFLKTGRAIETCYVKDFCDLFLISINIFDNILCKNYPNEMYNLRKIAIDEGNKKLANDLKLLNMVLEHSPRSVGKLYEIKYDKNNMWINIPIALPLLKFKKSENINYVEIKEHIPKIGLFDIGFFQMRKFINSIKNEIKIANKFSQKLVRKLSKKLSIIK